MIHELIHYLADLSFDKDNRLFLKAGITNDFNICQSRVYSPVDAAMQSGAKVDRNGEIWNTRETIMKLPKTKRLIAELSVAAQRYGIAGERR
ncbi:Hypothetical predicted protein [Podarcis lilfordi]|uniref:Uncharacterized protein n=1 Tax=Podarcis lilfordi TaxID=74358 RepID=A0AA35PDT5_9SAUR|nr:Hypothetical predicted protein [Podarcis lilfordi]